MDNIERVAGYGVVGLCVYEAVAMTTGRAPTLSALCRRYRAVEAALIVALLVHLHHAVKRDGELAETRERYRHLREVHQAWQRYLMRGRPGYAVPVPGRVAS